MVAAVGVVAVAVADADELGIVLGRSSCGSELVDVGKE